MTTETDGPRSKGALPVWAVFLLISVLVVGLLSAGIFLFSARAGTGPVPATIRNSVDFPVYYPASDHLPEGYTLDTNSFKLAETGVVVFSVLHSSGQLQFSEQQQPAQSVIRDFVKTYIPLHTSLKTSDGQAEIGSFGTGQNLRTVVSLPINNGPWLILTLPPSVSQKDLTTVVKALGR
jgi:hypothetical protein